MQRTRRPPPHPTHTTTPPPPFAHHVALSHQLRLLGATDGVSVASVRPHEGDSGRGAGRVDILERHVLCQDTSDLR